MTLKRLIVRIREKASQIIASYTAKRILRREMGVLIPAPIDAHNRQPTLCLEVEQRVTMDSIHPP